MNVSISRLEDILATGERARRWPNDAQHMLAKCQGDYDWVNEIRDDFHAKLEGLSGSVPLESLLPSYDEPLWSERYPHLYSWHLFFVANLLAAAREGEPELATTGSLAIPEPRTFTGSLRVEGDLDCRETLVVAGDLEVTGDVRTSHEIVVCGGVKVGGSWLGVDEFRSCALIGDVTIAGPLLTRGQLFVGGDVTAEAVYVDNPDWVGFVEVLGDLTARCLVETLEEPKCVVHGRARLAEKPADPQELVRAAFRARE